MTTPSVFDEYFDHGAVPDDLKSVMLPLPETVSTPSLPSVHVRLSPQAPENALSSERKVKPLTSAYFSASEPPAPVMTKPEMRLNSLEPLSYVYPRA